MYTLLTRHGYYAGCEHGPIGTFYVRIILTRTIDVRLLPHYSTTYSLIDIIDPVTDYSLYLNEDTLIHLNISYLSL